MDPFTLFNRADWQVNGLTRTGIGSPSEFMVLMISHWLSGPQTEAKAVGTCGSATSLRSEPSSREMKMPQLSAPNTLSAKTIHCPSGEIAAITCFVLNREQFFRLAALQVMGCECKPIPAHH